MLTAREWILLPQEEQIKRGKELSPEECRKLRMELSIPKFVTIGDGELTEEEKEEAYTHKMLEKVMHEFGRLLRISILLTTMMYKTMRMGTVKMTTLIKTLNITNADLM